MQWAGCHLTRSRLMSTIRASLGLLYTFASPAPSSSPAASVNVSKADLHHSNYSALLLRASCIKQVWLLATHPSGKGQALSSCWNLQGSLIKPLLCENCARSASRSIIKYIHGGKVSYTCRQQSGPWNAWVKCWRRLKQSSEIATLESPYFGCTCWAGKQTSTAQAELAYIAWSSVTRLAIEG